MTLHIPLTPVSEARLRGLAERAGTDVEHYVLQLIERMTASGDPVSSGSIQFQQARPFGLAKGSFEIPAGFFDPLPNDVVEAFEGASK